MPTADPAPAVPTLFLGDPEQPIELAVSLVSAYVSKNAVPAADLPALLRQVHEGILALGGPGATAPGHHAPAVDPAKSVFPDRLISLIDGRPYTMLKRHLAGHGYTPATYRAAFKLAGDYPMVCPNYSAQRAGLARAAGLGRKKAA